MGLLNRAQTKKENVLGTALSSPVDVAGSVVPVEGGQVDAGDDSEQPRGLPLLLDAPGHVAARAANHSWHVHAAGLHPAQVQRNPAVRG